MAYTLLDSAKVAGAGDITINTSGASLLVRGGVASGSGPAFTDDLGNTWTQSPTTLGGAFSSIGKLWYANATTNGGALSLSGTHKLSLTGDVFPAGFFASFTGGASDSYGDEKANAGPAGSPLTVPTLTPAEDNELLIGFIVGFDSAPYSDGGAFANALQTQNGAGGVNFGFTSRYTIQTSLAAIGATHTWGDGFDAGALTIAFKAAAAGGVVTARYYYEMLHGRVGN